MDFIIDIFRNMTWMERCILLNMFCFLALGAWYDMHGGEVPDAATVPYAILGSAAAFYRNQVLLGWSIIFVIVLILQPYRPKFLVKLNDWLVKKAYRDDEEKIFSEMNELSAEADSFANANDHLLDQLISFLLTMGPIAILLAGIWEPKNSDSAIAAVVVIAGFVLFKRALSATEDTQSISATDDPLPLSAFGEADILIVAGMLGCYGFFMWLIALIITFTGYLIYIGFKQILSKEKIMGAPLLPAVFFMLPLRFVAIIFLSNYFVG